MTKYYVQSGSLKAAIFAEDPFEAALESVQWWGGRADRDTDARQSRLSHEIRVFDGGFHRGAGQRFATLDLLARANGETIDGAWST